MRLRWKKDARETGLAAVVAGPRGSKYTDGTNNYATVNAHSFRRSGKTGWYWVSLCGEYVNTCNTQMDEATAKAQAAAHVKAYLAKEAA